MRKSTVLSAATLLCASLIAGGATLPHAVTASSNTPPIIVKQHKLFNSKSGEQFFVKGVAYQPRSHGKFEDPIHDGLEKVWGQHFPLWKELGVNALRVYELDPKRKHDRFMTRAQQEGIYLIFDLGRSASSLNRENPDYSLELLEQYKQTIDHFAGYDNVLAFFAGNEIANEPGAMTKSAPFTKALVRDLKAHMRTKKRYIPIGYATNDDADIRDDIRDYFVCGTDEGARIDILGYNVYSWCGDAHDFQSSGWESRTQEYETYPVPVILSEFGCNEVTPRTFPEVRAIFGPEMQDVFAGGIAYEFTEEDNKYGLVEIVNGQIKKLPDFDALADKYKSVRPKGPALQEFSALVGQRAFPSCPETTSSWQASTKLPPTPNECACRVLVESAECVAVTTENLSKRLGEVCDMLYNANGDGCTEVAFGDGERGTYGKFSQCSVKAKLTWAYDAWYKRASARHKATACDFGGAAQLQSPRNKTSIEECYTPQNETNNEDSAKSGAGSAVAAFAALRDIFLAGLMSVLVCFLV